MRTRYSFLTLGLAGALAASPAWAQDDKPEAEKAIEAQAAAQEKLARQAEEQAEKAAAQAEKIARQAQEQAEKAAKQAREAGEKAAKQARRYIVEGRRIQKGDKPGEPADVLKEQRFITLRLNPETGALEPVEGQIPVEGFRFDPKDLAGGADGPVVFGGQGQTFQLDRLGQLALLGLDGDLGLSVDAAGETLRSQLALPEGQGLVVREVDEDSRAAKAGLKKNDILLQVGEKNVASPEELANALREAGDENVKVTYLRAGKKETAELEPSKEEVTRKFFIGVQIGEVDEALREQLDLGDDAGVVVLEVVPDSPAAKAGLKKDDILLSYGGKPVTEAEELVGIVAENGEKEAEIEIVRGGEKQTVKVTPTKAPRELAVQGREREPRDRTIRFFGPGVMGQRGQAGPGVIPPGVSPRTFEFRGEGIPGAIGGMLPPERMAEIEKRIAEAMKRVEKEMPRAAEAAGRQLEQLQKRLEELQRKLEDTQQKLEEKAEKDKEKAEKDKDEPADEPEGEEKPADKDAQA